MKKFIPLIIFIISVFIIITNSYSIMENIRFSFSICINNLFPALIPFMLLSNILIGYNLIEKISDGLSFFTSKLFKLNKNCSFIIIMSILSGTPSNGKYINDLLNNNLIDINDGKKCLNFCHFINPIFILNTVGLTFLNNKKLGLIILMSHYISSFIIGIFKRNKDTNIQINKTTDTKYSFICILKESINNVINTLLLILGIITFFIIITGIISNIFNIPDRYKYLFGLLEITQGLKYLSYSPLPVNTKAIIASFFLSFGGLSIHAQILSLIDNKKIRYIPYLISRIIHGILSSLITFIIIS